MKRLNNIFKDYEDAKKYGEKNCFKYIVKETNQGNFVVYDLYDEK